MASCRLPEVSGGRVRCARKASPSYCGCPAARPQADTLRGPSCDATVLTVKHRPTAGARSATSLSGQPLKASSYTERPLPFQPVSLVQLWYDQPVTSVRSEGLSAILGLGSYQADRLQGSCKLHKFRRRRIHGLGHPYCRVRDRLLSGFYTIRFTWIKGPISAIGPTAGQFRPSNAISSVATRSKAGPNSSA